MNLRTSVLLAGLLAGALQGQATTPTQAATPGNANRTTTGAAPSRANGVPPTSTAGRGSRNASRSAGNGGSGNTGSGTGNSGGSNTDQPPAPAATARIQVTGRSSQVGRATIDRPLLPIATPGNGLGIVSGTPIQVTLRNAVDSGHAHNGDMLDATLAAPVAGMRAGTPVRLTVVAVARAGQLSSFGELSVQVVSIADHRVLSDTVTAQGKEGAKELPDAAPSRGTEAIFTPGQTISLPAA